MLETTTQAATQATHATQATPPAEAATASERHPPADRETVLADATRFLSDYQDELGRDDPARVTEAYRQLASTGTYVHDGDELAYAARVAWRNSNRCIGRLHWSTLGVRDCRHLTTADEIFEACVEHLRAATNGGKLRSLITVFAPHDPASDRAIRIWNPQLVRYAGWRDAGGAVLGDAQNIELTAVLEGLGWQPRERTAFTVLPLAIQAAGQPVRLFELPSDAILEVPLTHPEHAWFADLGLRWHAVPAISDMALEAGGVTYTAAPFNGWYMGTEIGARNLADTGRYDLLPVVAQRLGLDTRSDRTLWKDRALVELNVAVLHSFKQHGVTLIDHHLASRQFMLHVEREHRAGRETHGDWSWLVPPMSGSTCPVFHRYYPEEQLRPEFVAQQPAWRDAPAGSSPAARPSSTRVRGACPHA